MSATVAKSSKRGSAPGERRGGRQKGTPNKSTAELRAVAQEYTEAALKTLASVMNGDDQPAAARVSAANSILDRAYGKPTQAIVGDEDAGPAIALTLIKTMTDEEVAEEYNKRVG